MFITSVLGTNMELTYALKEYAENRMNVLEKFASNFDDSAKMRIELGKSSQNHKNGSHFFAEVHMDIPGRSVNAKVEDEDLYAAIDKVQEEMKRQLVDAKEKELTKRKQPRPGKE